MNIMSDGIVIRKLERGDYDMGFLQVLGELTAVGEISREAFDRRFDEITSTSSDYHIYVAENVMGRKIVGTGTLVVERKFIHGCGLAGHIEDVVVSSTCRGQNLGRRIITRLLDAGRDAGCYKIILDCAEKNVEFYKKCGLDIKGVQMALYNDRQCQ